MNTFLPYRLSLSILLFVNFAFANSSGLACVADAGPDQILSCVLTDVTLDGSNSTSGANIIYTWVGPGINASNMNEQNPVVNEAGTYLLTVENTADACSTSDEVIVVADQMLPIAVANVNGILNCVNTAVLLDGSGSNAGPNIVYEWIDANGNLIGDNESILVTIPGDYTLVVTNSSNGCTSETSVSVNQDVTPPFATISSTTLLPCQANSTVLLDGSNSAGSSSIIFEWYSPSGNLLGTSPTLEVSVISTYTLVVTDVNNGCTSQDIIDVVFLPIMDVNYTVVQAGSCGICDGAVDLIVTGSSGPFTFDWSEDTFDGQEDPVALCDGTIYYVTVTDTNNSCTTTLEINDFNLSIGLDLTSTYAGCGVDDGTASVTVSAGATDPVFSWSNGGTGSSQSGLSPGGYSVTVVDNVTGCSSHKNIIVEEDPACKVHISGYVYNDDTDQNCDETTAIGGVNNIMITLSNGDITFTDSAGYYEFSVDPGSYEISINLNTPQFLGLCVDTITVDLPDYGSLAENNNFFVIYNTIQDLNIKVVKWPARPGFIQHVIICAMNFGQFPIDGTVVFTHDSIQQLTNTSGPALSTSTYDTSAYTVMWDFTGLPPGAIWVYHAYLHLDPTVPIGTPLDYYFALEPIVGDINPSNNVIECILEVTGSYDPNDKRAIPMGLGDEGYITRADSLLNYTIRFQNTGNDTAFTVVIRDTLDESLDMNTLVPLPSCRPYRLDVVEDRVLEFTFDNILLPDSTTNEPESHGFVMYDIEMLPWLDYGTVIENRAGIYFDYNQPIITNTTKNTLSKKRATIGGSVQTEWGANISEVFVDLIGGDTSTTIMANGNYLFENIPTESDYTILPSRSDNPLNGITSFDLVLISKHILNVTPFDSPYKVIAADINSSGGVSTIDLLELRKLILQIYDEFPENKSWRFIDADHVFPDPMNPYSPLFPEEIFIPNFMEDRNNVDFIGVKIGDVNESVVPLTAGTDNREHVVNQLVLKTENRLLQKGKEYAIAFNAGNFKEIVGCQFTIDFDVNNLEFIGFEKGDLPQFDGNNLGLTHLEKGAILLSWNGQKTSLSENTPLFNLRFKAKRSIQLKDAIQINSRHIQKEAYREKSTSFELLDVALLFEDKTTEQIQSEQLIVFPNRPNPFKEETTISFYLPQGEETELLIFDVNGKALKTHQQYFDKGVNEFSLKGSVFDKSGLYYYQIKTSRHSVIRKMLVAF